MQRVPLFYTEFKVNNTYWPRLLTIALLLLSFYPAAQTDERQMDEIVLTKGKKVYKSKKENPAYAIMQEVWKRKRNNGLDKFDTYSFREYEKIQFDMANIDSAFMNRKVFKKLDFIFDYADSAANGNLALPLFLNESVYTNIGQNNPSKRKKRLLVAQKTSGFEDNQIVTLTAKNLYKEIDIYDNTINYFDIGFQSPVSRDGFSTYNYELMDTLTLNGQEVYHIRYEPRRSDVLAFEGQLYISTDHYAVTQATLRSTSNMRVDFVHGIFTELAYDNPNDSTFLPKKYRTVLDLSAFSKSKNAKSLTATRSVDYTDYKFNPVLSAVDFETKEAELRQDFIRKDDQYWEAARIDSLNQQEKGIYEMLDKLEETPRFRRITKTYETFASG